MKLFRKSLRIIIAAGSLTGFLGGWALLAHSPKPQPLNAVQQSSSVAPLALPTLAPIPSLEENGSQIREVPSLPQSIFSVRPRLRSGGS